MVVKISSAEQLFLDDYLIEKLENITRNINPARKHPEPVLRGDQSWEAGYVILYGTVLYDSEEKIFKMWYFASGDTGYAVSKDGIVWTKPELDIITRNGKKTNLVIQRSKEKDKPGPFGYLYEHFNIHKDNNEPDPERRYKAVFLLIEPNYKGKEQALFHPGSRRGAGTLVSPDGLRWKIENELVSYDICDIGTFSWDSLKNQYLVYGRTKLTFDKNDGRWSFHGWGRAVNRIESNDFKEWSKGEFVMAADPRDPEGSEIYTLGVFNYEGIYIGLTQMYYGLEGQGNLEIQLSVSRDGKNFTRVEPRQAFIPEGKISTWDRFNISVANQPVVVGDELWFYYGGRTYRHPPYVKVKDSGPGSGSIGLAKIKRGRFVSLEAGFDKGTVLTRPLIFPGAKFFINADTLYGTIQINLLDEKGQIISGAETMIAGQDGISIPVKFEGISLENYKDKSVKIQFTLSNARLFGFRIK